MMKSLEQLKSPRLQSLSRIKRTDMTALLPRAVPTYQEARSRDLPLQGLLQKILAFMYLTTAFRRLI